MNPQTIWSTTRVVFYILVLAGGIVFYRDYTSAPVKWSAGQVVDKVTRDKWSSDRQSHSYSYFLRVNVGGETGNVRVTSFAYSRWRTGDACEVESRHGRILNYDYADIRHPGAERGESGRWWFF